MENDRFDEAIKTIDQEMRIARTEVELLARFIAVKVGDYNQMTTMVRNIVMRELNKDLNHNVPR